MPKKDYRKYIYFRKKYISPKETLRRKNKKEDKEKQRHKRLDK